MPDIRANNVCDIGERNLDRRRQYGTPLTPILREQTLNRLLHQITRNERISRVRMDTLPAKRQVKDASTTETRKDLEVMGDVDCTDWRQPVRWATQREVKAELPRAQEIHKQGVIHHLAALADEKPKQRYLQAQTGARRRKNPNASKTTGCSRPPSGTSRARHG